MVYVVTRILVAVSFGEILLVYHYSYSPLVTRGSISLLAPLRQILSPHSRRTDNPLAGFRRQHFRLRQGTYDMVPLRHIFHRQRNTRALQMVPREREIARILQYCRSRKIIGAK